LLVETLANVRMRPALQPEETFKKRVGLNRKKATKKVMNTYRPLACLLLACPAVFLLASSDKYLAAQLRNRISLFAHLQEKTERTLNASPAQPTQSGAKTASSLLIRPPSRMSETLTVSGDRRAGSPDAAFNPDDNEYLVVWETDGLTELKGVNDIYGQRLSAVTNERIGIAFRISSLSDGNKNHTSNDPKVVYNRAAREYLVIWHGSGPFKAPDYFFDVYGQRLSRTGKEIGSDFRISYTTDLGKINTNFVRSSTQAEVAWNSADNEYLVIWTGMGEPEDLVKMEIYGQRLKANGEFLGKYFRISHTTDQGINFHANAPAIAYNSRDNQYLVVWSGGFKNESQVEVWGKGLTALGKALGPMTGGALAAMKDFRISQVSDVGADRGASSPQVVYNNVNNEYFVVFQANALRAGGSANANEIFGQRIDAATLAETGANDFRISNTVDAGNRAIRPAVTFNSVAKEYLVIWRCSRQNASHEISGQRISAGGTEIEADFQISNIASVGEDRSVNNSSLTHNTGNGEYLVIWQGNGLPSANTAKITEIFGQQLALARSQQQ